MTTTEILRVFEIDDGERHVVAARDEADAIVCLAESFDMSRDDIEMEWGDAPPVVRELNIGTTLDVRYDSLEDLRLLFKHEECPLPKKIVLLGEPKDILKGRCDPVMATFQVLMLTHSKRGLVSSTVY